MNKKMKGFSLAELLVSLLVISLVLSAAIPAVTRRSGQQREQVWHWTNQNNAAFTAVGSNQGVLIGSDGYPMAGTAPKDLMQGKSITSDDRNPENTASYNIVYSNFNNTTVTPRFENKMAEIPKINGVETIAYDSNDKIVLLKRQTNYSKNMASSHISFYNVPSTNRTASNVEYAGRLSLDSGNIALGIGALQNEKGMDEAKEGNSPKGNAGENTAIGHLALFNNITGYRNSAFGKKTLANNSYGSYNTALGFGSLFNVGINGITGCTGTNDCNYENTAAGNGSLHYLQFGNYNTALGSYAMKYLMNGNSNTAIGRAAMPYLKNDNESYDVNKTRNENTAIGAASLLGLRDGNRNTAIGTGACAEATAGSGNICIGYQAGKSVVKTGVYTQPNYELFIGGGSPSGTKPLIQGHTEHQGRGTNEYKQDLIVNAEQVAFYDKDQTRNFALFDPKIASGDDGRGEISLYTYFDDSGSAEAAPYLRLKKDGASGLYLDLDGAGSYISAETSIANANRNGFNVSLSNRPVNISTSGTSTITLKSAVSSSNIGTLTLNGNTVTVSGNLIIGAKNTISNTNFSYIGLSGNNSQNLNTIIGQISNDIQTLNSTKQPLSDARLKNISGDNKAGLKEINKLEVKNFTFKKDEKKTPHVGVIAQQLMKVFPDAVTKGEDGYYRIRTEDIFYAMVNAVKELCAQVQDLMAKAAGLDKRLTELEAQNKLLKEQNAAFEKRLEALEKRK